MSNTRNSNDDLNPLWQAHQKFLRSQRNINLTSRLHAVLYDRCIDFFGAVEEDRQHRAGFEQPTITSPKRIPVETLKTLRNFARDILSIPIVLPPLFFVVRKASWIEATSNMRSDYFDRRIKLTLHLEGSVAPISKTVSRRIRHIRVFLFGSSEGSDKDDRERLLERKMDFSERAHAVQYYKPELLEICFPVEAQVDVDNGSFKCVVLVNWLNNATNGGNLNMHIEAIDDDGVVWTAGPDLTFPVLFKR